MAAPDDERWAMYRRVVERAWADPDFKEQLLADPTGTLAAEGYKLRPHETIEIVQDTKHGTRFFLPEPESEITC